MNKHTILFNRNFIAKMLTLASLLLTPVLSHAELNNSATLSFRGGDITESEDKTRPANGSGSWFAMELRSGTWVYTGINGKNGVKIGETQDAETAGGLKDPIESNIDLKWKFFNIYGLHQTTKAPTILNDDGEGNVSLDFSGWSIDWNGIPGIPMSGGAQLGADNDLENDDGEALMVCSETCGNGDSYTLNYTATVPPGSGTNFNGVKYHVHLEGKIASDDTSPNLPYPDQPRAIDINAPVTSIAHGALIAGGRTKIDLRGKVTDPQGNDTIDFSSLNFADTCEGGGVTFATAVGVVEYADGKRVEESCAVTYTVKDKGGLESAEGTITIRVRIGNIAPIANDDSLVAAANETVEINVLENDFDGDDAIDVATLKTQGGSGRVSVNTATGIIAYTPAAGATGTDSFTYTFTDSKDETSNTGTVSIRINAAPIAVNDALVVGRNGSVSFDVLGNDEDDGGLNPATVFATEGANGSTKVDTETGAITYTPAKNYLGSDSFEYSVKDTDGLQSNTAVASVNVINVVPEAGVVSATLNIAIGTNTVIDPLKGVTDADGILDATTIRIVTPPENGVATVDPTTGAITYRPNADFIGVDSITFTVNDNDGETSNEGTINVTVTDASLAILNPASILSINPGAQEILVKPEIGAGSWFAMEASGWLYTGISGNQGLQLTQIQSATSKPLSPGIDTRWEFFGNGGVSLTTSEVNIISDDGAGTVLLDFSGWGVSWNGIPVIPLNLRPHGGVEGGPVKNSAGVAVMRCEKDCSNGETYTLVYTATVPDGDASGFGNVSYELHLEGKISLELPTVGGGDAEAIADVISVVASDTIVLGEDDERAVSLAPGDTAQSLGNERGLGIAATNLGLPDPAINPDNGGQCIGGCNDFAISGVATGEQVQIVYRMTQERLDGAAAADPSVAIPNGAIYRQFINGKWAEFDQSEGDEIGSSAAQDNNFCTDASGIFATGLQPGNQCVFLNVRDGGLNDGDGLVNGVVRTLGGVALTGEDNRPKGSSSGCSVTGDPVSLYQRGDWLFIFGFLIWLAIVVRKRNLP